jgi:hypothetical protein
MTEVGRRLNVTDSGLSGERTTGVGRRWTATDSGPSGRPRSGAWMTVPAEESAAMAPGRIGESTTGCARR